MGGETQKIREGQRPRNVTLIKKFADMLQKGTSMDRKGEVLGGEKFQKGDILIFPPTGDMRREEGKEQALLVFHKWLLKMLRYEDWKDVYYTNGKYTGGYYDGVGNGIRFYFTLRNKKSEASDRINVMVAGGKWKRPDGSVYVVEPPDECIELYRFVKGKEVLAMRLKFRDIFSVDFAPISFESLGFKPIPTTTELNKDNIDLFK
ncbi:MAG: hypothetical protein M1592_00180 [Candidatus Thermoplasmatota archaeon]|jgi:hypothetical protein|nr:hypothetical protein [Candidatus Thermoplasmatota archaeon]MDA8054250.1 hypothetical protein [Thermoplasmatales archaeon]